MERGWFDQAVPVVLEDGGGTIDRVSNAHQAANLLLNHWPVRGGKSHREARKACFDVLSGLKAGVVARQAFADAAREAKVLVEE